MKDVTVRFDPPIRGDDDSSRDRVAIHAATSTSEGDGSPKWLWVSKSPSGPLRRVPAASINIWDPAL